jgi:hypothetical protein
MKGEERLTRVTTEVLLCFQQVVFQNPIQPTCSIVNTTVPYNHSHRTSRCLNPTACHLQLSDHLITTYTIETHCLLTSLHISIYQPIHPHTSWLKMKAVCSYERQYLRTCPRSATNQKTNVVIFTAMRASNLTYFDFYDEA